MESDEIALLILVIVLLIVLFSLPTLMDVDTILNLNQLRIKMGV